MTARAGGTRSTGGRELDFLPAVLEIQERPPSPLGRALAGVIMLALVLAILWAFLGRLDIVAVAEGKTVPSQRSKIIQPMEQGVVRAVHVEDGQRVAAGAPLITLDTTVAEAERAALADRRAVARVEAARLRALLQGEAHLAVPSGVPEALAAAARERLGDTLAARRARRAAAARVVAQRQAAVEVTRAHRARLAAVLPLLEERVGALAAMLDEGYASRVDYLQAEQERIGSAQELVALGHQLARDRAALEEARAAAESLEAGFVEADRAALDEQLVRVRGLDQELVKATRRSGLYRLEAPIAGTVQQLAVHTVGGVVTPAQALLTIVPERDRLEVEAWLANKDVGFVHPGQEAAVKVEAFPFTRYGTVPGEIFTLSREAVAVEGRGLLYAARVRLHAATLSAGSHTAALGPGMSVRVEIKTGRRRVIDFFLAPLLKGLRETARER